MRLFRIASLLAALSLFGVCTPAARAIDTWPPPKLKVAGEIKYKPYTLVRLKAENLDAKAGVIWRVYPSAGVQRATTPRGVLEFVAPPGVYRVELLVIRSGADGALDVEEQSVDIEIESPEPKPAPPGPPAPGPKTKPDPVNALGRIQFGSAGCTATVIGPQRPDGRWDVLTATHCITRVGQRGTMALKDGRKLNLTAVYKSKEVEDGGPDVCWCVTDEKFPDLAYAEIAKENPPVGTKIWHMGYGVDRPGNREEGQVTGGEQSNGQIQMSLNVSSGDSGGGIFREDTGELVSVVCCTQRRGATAPVFGSSPLSARKTRPGAVADDAAWLPFEIPQRAESPVLPAAPGCCPAR